MDTAMFALVVRDLSHLHKGQDMLKSVLYACKSWFAHGLDLEWYRTFAVLVVIFFDNLFQCFVLETKLWIDFVSYNIYWVVCRCSTCLYYHLCSVIVFLLVITLIKGRRLELLANRKTERLR